MRAISISVDVGIDEFDDVDIKKHLESRGYTVVKKGEKTKGCEGFEFQKEAINEMLTDAINKHGYNKVLKVLENTSFKT